MAECAALRHCDWKPAEYLRGQPGLAVPLRRAVPLRGIIAAWDLDSAARPLEEPAAGLEDWLVNLIGFCPGTPVPVGVPMGVPGAAPTPTSFDGSQINSNRR